MLMRPVLKFRKRWRFETKNRNFAYDLKSGLHRSNESRITKFEGLVVEKKKKKDSKRSKK